MDPQNRSELSSPCLFLFFHLFPHLASPPQRRKLNQLNGYVVQAQFWFSVSPTELYRSALVTSLLTLSFSLMWTQEGWLHRGFGAYPGSGEVPLNTCRERYVLGQSLRVMVSSFGLFTSLLSIVFPLWMLTSLSDSLHKFSHHLGGHHTCPFLHCCLIWNDHLRGPRWWSPLWKTVFVWCVYVDSTAASLNTSCEAHHQRDRERWRLS